MVLLSFTHIFTSSPTLRIEKSEEIFVSTKNKLLSISSPSTRPTLFVANKTKHSTGGKTGAPDSVYDNKVRICWLSAPDSIVASGKQVNDDSWIFEVINACE